MVNYESIIPISWGPCDELIKKILDSKKSSINLFIDLKNVSVGLFVEDIGNEIIKNCNINNKLDNNIFQSILFLLYKWTFFFKTNNFKYKIFICNDKGESQYHLRINKDYKKNRQIGKTEAEMYRSDMLNSIRNKNYDIAYKICNCIENVYFITLRNLESDFLPYYIMTRKIDTTDSFNIVCSGDKDHYQIISKVPNTVMYFKRNGESYVMDKRNVIPAYIKYDKLSDKNKETKKDSITNFDISYISLMMSLVGDKVDNVFGIDKVGPIKAFDFLKDPEKNKYMFGDVERLIDNMMNNCSIFNEGVELEGNFKLLQENEKRITDAFKQIDFEYLSRDLDKQNTLFKSEVIDELDFVLSKKKFNVIKSPKVMFDMLSKLDNFRLKYEEIKTIL